MLQCNLFGVDRSATAVRLAELRLWLAVIAGDHAERPGKVQPLPNLDCLVRQGDSLFDPLGSAVVPDPVIAARVSGVRRAVVTAVGAAKKPIVRELRLLESRAAEESFASAEARLRAGISECIETARGRDLFGQRRGLDASLEARLGGLRAELRAVRAARRTLEREHELPWFHYQSHFADVFAAGGFDMVVGNPPWLRAEEIAPQQRQRLTGRYRWWRGGGGFGNRPDLSIAFLERALELVAPDGVVALLLPAKVATARYGAVARHALASTTTLISVSDLTGHPDASFDATVYPLAMIARNTPPPPGHRVRTALHPGEGERIAQARLAGGGPWILSGGRARRVLADLTREQPVLGTHFACHLGLKTGANALFLNPPESVEAALVRRAIRGRDVRPFTPTPRARLLYTHGADGAPLASLPPGAAAHLGPHEAALRKRADFGGGPPWALFRTRSATAQHRVIWPDLARQLTAAALTADDDHDAHSTQHLLRDSNGVEGRGGTAGGLAQLHLDQSRGAAHCRAGRERVCAVWRGRRERVAASHLGAPDHRLDVLARSARNGGAIQHELDDLAALHLGLSASDKGALRSVVGVGAAHRR